jgi:hypothetical protein
VECYSRPSSDVTRKLPRCVTSVDQPRYANFQYSLTKLRHVWRLWAPIRSRGLKWNEHALSTLWQVELFVQSSSRFLLSPKMRWYMVLLGATARCTSTAAGYHNNAGVLNHVNPKIETNGIPPSYIGGMIPSVGLPFGKTRWTAQTRENFQAQSPYFEQDEYIHGFQATHQSAIWMGESG